MSLGIICWCTKIVFPKYVAYHFLRFWPFYALNGFACLSTFLRPALIRFFTPYSYNVTLALPNRGVLPTAPPPYSEVAPPYVGTVPPAESYPPGESYILGPLFIIGFSWCCSQFLLWCGLIERSVFRVIVFFCSYMKTFYCSSATLVFAYYAGVLDGIRITVLKCLTGCLSPNWR